MDAVRIPSLVLPSAMLQGQTYDSAHNTNNTDYIKDGLVFHLDGLDKGSTQGAWTDLVNGIEFYPTANLLKGANVLKNSKGYALGNYSWDNRPPVETQCTVTICAKVGEKDDAITIVQNNGYGNVGRFTSKTETIQSFTFSIQDYASANSSIFSFFHTPNDSDFDPDTYVKWAVVTFGDSAVKEWVPALSERNDIYFGYDYVMGHLKANVPVAYDIENSTIEFFVRYRTRLSDSVWFNSGQDSGICGGLFDGNFAIKRGNEVGYAYKLPNSTDIGYKAISASKERILFNGETNDNAENIDSIESNQDYASIGQVNSNNLIQYCSIRIYNRLLTEKEMRYNQQVDYKRFDVENYGKNVYVLVNSDSIGASINKVDSSRTYYKVTPNKWNKITIKDSDNFNIASEKYIQEADLSNYNINILASIFSQSYIGKIVLPNCQPSSIGLMCYNCQQLTDIDMSLVDFSKCTYTYNSFASCRSLTNLKFGKNYCNTAIGLSSSPLTHASALSVIDGLDNVTTPLIVQFSEKTYLTLTQEEIALATAKGWNVVVPTSLQGKIIKVTSLTDTVDITINGVTKTYSVTPNVPSVIIVDEVVTDLSYAFHRQTQLTDVDLSNLDTSNTTTINNLFEACLNLKNIDITIDTKKVTNINAVFISCNSLQSVKGLENWDTSNVIMFRNFCKSAHFSSLDISHFNLGGLQKGISMIGLGSAYLILASYITDLKFGYNLKISIDLSDSVYPLTHESALSVINGLAEITTNETVTFKSATYNTLTSEEIAMATSKGWTIVSA